MLIKIILRAFAVVFLCCAASEAKLPRILVTIKPIHSLVCALVGEHLEVDLLFPDHKSPHTYQVTPSEAERLAQADVVIWVGPSYESGLAGRFSQPVSGNQQRITLTELSGVMIYPHRGQEIAEQNPSTCSQDACHDVIQDCCGHTVHLTKSSQEALSKDGHIWLAPHNAQAIVTALAERLSQRFPHLTSHFLARAQELRRKLQDLGVQMSQELSNVRNKPYFTVHDGMQYFDRYFGTQLAGVIRTNPGLAPSARHMYILQKKLGRVDDPVIFYEPQFSKNAVQVLADTVGARVAEIDYLGVGLSPGPDCYFEMMHRLASNVCQALNNTSG